MLTLSLEKAGIPDGNCRLLGQSLDKTKIVLVETREFHALQVHHPYCLVLQDDRNGQFRANLRIASETIILRLAHVGNDDRLTGPKHPSVNAYIQAELPPFPILGQPSDSSYLPKTLFEVGQGHIGRGSTGGLHRFLTYRIQNAIQF